MLLSLENPHILEEVRRNWIQGYSRVSLAFIKRIAIREVGKLRKESVELAFSDVNGRTEETLSELNSVLKFFIP